MLNNESFYEDCIPRSAPKPSAPTEVIAISTVPEVSLVFEKDDTNSKIIDCTKELSLPFRSYSDWLKEREQAPINVKSYPIKKQVHFNTEKQKEFNLNISSSKTSYSTNTLDEAITKEDLNTIQKRDHNEEICLHGPFNKSNVQSVEAYVSRNELSQIYEMMERQSDQIILLQEKIEQLLNDKTNSKNIFNTDEISKKFQDKATQCSLLRNNCKFIVHKNTCSIGVMTSFNATNGENCLSDSLPNKNIGFSYTQENMDKISHKFLLDCRDKNCFDNCNPYTPEGENSYKTPKKSPSLRRADQKIGSNRSDEVVLDQRNFGVDNTRRTSSTNLVNNQVNQKTPCNCVKSQNEAGYIHKSSPPFNISNNNPQEEPMNLALLPQVISERSLAINALAMKYLPEDKLKKLAVTNTQNNGYEKSSNEMSMGTYRYMTKYGLMNHFEGEIPRCFVKETFKDKIQNRFLDITAIKKQPKFV